jgi:hypothetical protein
MKPDEISFCHSHDWRIVGGSQSLTKYAFLLDFLGIYKLGCFWRRADLITCDELGSVKTWFKKQRKTRTRSKYELEILAAWQIRRNAMMDASFHRKMASRKQL